MCVHRCFVVAVVDCWTLANVFVCQCCWCCCFLIVDAALLLLLVAARIINRCAALIMIIVLFLVVRGVVSMMSFIQPRIATPCHEERREIHNVYGEANDTEIAHHDRQQRKQANRREHTG